MDFTIILMGAIVMVLIFINIHLLKTRSKDNKININELKEFVNKQNKKYSTSNNIDFFDNNKSTNSIFEQLNKKTNLNKVYKKFTETPIEKTVNFDNNKTKVFTGGTNFFSEKSSLNKSFVESDKSFINNQSTTNEQYNVMEELIKQIKSKNKSNQLHDSNSFEKSDLKKNRPKELEKKPFENRFPIAGDD